MSVGTLEAGSAGIVYDTVWNIAIEGMFTDLSPCHSSFARALEDFHYLIRVPVTR